MVAATEAERFSRPSLSPAAIRAVLLAFRVYSWINPYWQGIRKPGRDTTVTY